MFVKSLPILILVTVAISAKSESDESLDKGDLQGALNQFGAYLNDSNQQLRLINEQLAEIRGLLAKSSTKPPKHCQEVQDRGHSKAGIYQLQPNYANEPFLAWCDNGWTYLLNRFDGSQDFDLDWEDYKNGFGNLAGEFWLGLQHLHALTGFEVNELLIELEDWDSKEVSARYDSFGVGSETEGYALRVLGQYTGDAGDSFSYHTGMKFTTKDVDQDRYNGGNCGTYRGGGWWYKNCVNSHLTGRYMKGQVELEDEYKIMYWGKFHGHNYSLKKARMMVRPLKQKDNIANEENGS